MLKKIKKLVYNDKLWEYPRLPLSERTFIMEKDDFLKKLEKLVAHAKSKHNTVDAGEINDFLSEITFLRSRWIRFTVTWRTVISM